LGGGWEMEPMLLRVGVVCFFWCCPGFSLVVVWLIGWLVGWLVGWLDGCSLEMRLQTFFPFSFNSLLWSTNQGCVSGYFFCRISASFPHPTRHDRTAQFVLKWETRQVT
jgi:hypothetical protein